LKYWVQNSSETFEILILYVLCSSAIYNAPTIKPKLRVNLYQRKSTGADYWGVDSLKQIRLPVCHVKTVFSF